MPRGRTVPVSPEWVAGHVLGGTSVCIEHWQNRSSYGHMKVHGRVVLIHRYVYALKAGTDYWSIPSDSYVMHSCDNPKCINPNHLTLGSPLDNQRDMLSKGRGSKRAGAGHHKAGITLDKALEIQRLLRSGLGCSAIAEAAGVSLRTVEGIRYGGNWGYRHSLVCSPVCSPVQSGE